MAKLLRVTAIADYSRDRGDGDVIGWSNGDGGMDTAFSTAAESPDPDWDYAASDWVDGYIDPDGEGEGDADLGIDLLPSILLRWWP